MGKQKKRLHLVPLLLGAYGLMLGLGLTVIGLAEIKKGIGIVRLLLGLGMACFGLYGLWDGVRDVFQKPDDKISKPAQSQFILTDTAGRKSSLVTFELLRQQINSLVESKNAERFSLQVVPPLPSGECGLLKWVLCVYHTQIIMVAFFETYQMYQISLAPDEAEAWLKQLLAGNADFSAWANVEIKIRQDEAVDAQDDKEETEDYPSEIDAGKEDMAHFGKRMLDNQSDVLHYWHKRLIIYGENWHDEHVFFSERDVELAIEGVQEGKYQQVMLEWGMDVWMIRPRSERTLLVVWRTAAIAPDDVRFLAKEGTMVQVQFWLRRYLSELSPGELSGWADVTKQITKGRKKHGKLF